MKEIKFLEVDEGTRNKVYAVTDWKEMGSTIILDGERIRKKSALYKTFINTEDKMVFTREGLRAKEINKKYWVKGSLVKYKKEFYLTSKGWRFAEDKISLTITRVDPDTFGESCFITRRDKIVYGMEGIEYGWRCGIQYGVVYEGDILRRGEMIGEMVFSNIRYMVDPKIKRFGNYLLRIETSDATCFLGMYRDQQDQYEVIGNIYDTPNLVCKSSQIPKGLEKYILKVEDDVRIC